jgi:hypothetical protein
MGGLIFGSIAGMIFMMTQADEQEILQLFADGDRALIAADAAEMRRIYAADYVQYDELGGISTRQEVIDRLTSGHIRFVSMKSTGRAVRLLRSDVAIVQGSEEDEVDRAGQRSTVRYIYMDIVMKPEGRWQIVASQLVKLSCKHQIIY